MASLGAFLLLVTLALVYSCGGIDAATSLFAGHVPNRVLIGFAAPDDGNKQWAFPGWTEAQKIVGRKVYVHRTFTSSTSPSSWLTWIKAEHSAAYNKAQGPVYPLLSVKSTDWAGIRDGKYDSTWATIREWAKTRRTSGANGKPQPFTLTFNHEPDGDGDLKVWGQAQNRMSNYFAGWTTLSTGAKGTRTAANDISDIMAWHCIPNGHWWGPKARKQDRIDAAVPNFLVKNFRENRGIISPDFYDPNPQNDDASNPNRDLPPLSYATNADRTSKKIQSFIDDMRSRPGGPPAIGCGEFSATEATEITAVWKVIRANRDIWGYASHFSSPMNSRFPWRLIPDSYPGGQHPDSFDSGGVLVLRDFGGTKGSESRLNAFRKMLDESVSANYTLPIVRLEGDSLSTSSNNNKSVVASWQIALIVVAAAVLAAIGIAVVMFFVVIKPKYLAQRHPPNETSAVEYTSM